ncbi:MAG: hypothetical protein AB7C89_07475 [Intestinibacillus sp.]
MNKRKFIISTGAFLMLVMLIVGYAAADAVNSGREAPRVTEEYRAKALTSNTAPVRPEVETTQS